MMAFIHKIRGAGRYVLPALFMLAIFWGAAVQTSPPPRPIDLAPDVVIPSAVQVVLYGGDRFLAANVEQIRAAASGEWSVNDGAGYRLRAHRVVSQLNPCHEDNYWFGNAALSFGGAVDAGSELLGRASQCRFWDDLPPFLYGFNHRFFKLDAVTARKAIEIAADRATTNAPVLRQLAIIITVNTIKDAKAARAMLQMERDKSRDPILHKLLDQRIERMNGLIILREAKAEYERRFGVVLTDPKDLLKNGVLKEFPKDPLRLGYRLERGEFVLETLKVEGFN